ncbi:MAG: 4-alpha-glucanotransferase [Deltaproteobacteria bacterium]|nr:4-alpha-glucanotransferase [Deltaproteobacteria bacterium]
MSKLSHEQIINALAVSLGIEQEYTDNWGTLQHTSLDTNQNILKALGVDVDTEARANKAWHVRQEDQWSQLAEPAIVASLANPPDELLFQVPASQETTSEGSSIPQLEVALEVTDESGRVHNFRFSSKDLTLRESHVIGNRLHKRWGFPFPRLQTLGYYRFHLSVSTEHERWSQAISVAVCPEQAYVPPTIEGDGRLAGIGISLYGVRSEKNWGIGDFGDLKEILCWAADNLNASMVALNPLHATFNRSPFNTSPYLPMSRLYRNFIYLDVPAMEDYKTSREAQDLVNQTETQRLLTDVRTSDTVAYEEVAALKHRVLEKVFRNFLERHWNGSNAKTDRQKDFEDYMEREGAPLDYFATFCALDAALRSQDPEMWVWSQWPAEYQRPDTEAVGQFAQAHWEEVLFYKFIQWQTEKQLAEVQEYARDLGMSIGLYHDLALGVDRFSADFWAYQDFFVRGLRLGAPPDAFSQHGQDWGFTPPNIEKLRETGYDLFAKEIRKNCACGGALRIDHVMRFFHLYCIPEGGLPKDGAYVSQPLHDLLGIVALESVRNKVVIVGEDLGTVPPQLRGVLAKANILSYRLLYFEKDEQQGFILPQNYPELALVTITTHDLPTLAGFWRHADIKIREEAGMFNDPQAVINASNERESDKRRLLDVLKVLELLPVSYDNNKSAHEEVSGEIHTAVMGFLAMTPAKLFLVSQEDLFKETDQQNLPGTTSEYPNWSLKMKHTVEQLSSDSEVRRFCEVFGKIVERSGRNNHVV